MNRNLVIALIAVLAVALLLLGANSRKQQEVARLSSDLYALHDSLHTYKILDSLNAAQTTALRLKADEYRELYANEQELVSKLRADKAGLMATISLQSKTISKLQATLQPVYVTDTLYVIRDTIYCFSYSDKWVDFSGCVRDSILDVDLTTRDELFIVESAQRKRFLGIPLPISWFGYKSRTVDAVNMNPNAVITNINYKTIEK